MAILTIVFISRLRADRPALTEIIQEHTPAEEAGPSRRKLDQPQKIAPEHHRCEGEKAKGKASLEAGRLCDRGDHKQHDLHCERASIERTETEKVRHAFKQCIDEIDDEGRGQQKEEAPMRRVIMDAPITNPSPSCSFGKSKAEAKEKVSGATSSQRTRASDQCSTRRQRNCTHHMIITLMSVFTIQTGDPQ